MQYRFSKFENAICLFRIFLFPYRTFKKEYTLKHTILENFQLGISSNNWRAVLLKTAKGHTCGLQIILERLKAPNSVAFTNFRVLLIQTQKSYTE